MSVLHHPILGRVKSVLRRGFARIVRQSPPPPEPDLVEYLHARIIAQDRPFYHERAVDTVKFYERVDPEMLADFVGRIFGGPHEYFDYHRYRLSELYCLIHDIVEREFFEEPFTLIEVSTAGDFFARTLSQSFGPRMTYVPFNYPADEGGTGGDDLTAYAALSIEANLNDLDDYEASSDLLNLIEDKNVIVMASEIVEHLLLDVGNFVAAWTGLTSGARKGQLIVTTPNYLADWRVSALGRGVNCQERYKDPERVRQGFVHIREYSPKEMLDSVSELEGTSQCAFSFGMPGGNRPQLSLQEYLETRRTLLDSSASLVDTILRSEGLVAIYPIGQYSS